jgi:hypothetical protein
MTGLTAELGPERFSSEWGDTPVSRSRAIKESDQ